MNTLLRLIGRRLIALPIMIIGVTILVFFLMSLSPIDQAYSVLGENASEAQVQQYRVEHGLNDPVVVQYGRFMAGLVHGDLGTYGANNAPVSSRIASALPVTLQLTFAGLIIAVVIAVVLGVISALHRDKWPDQLYVSSRLHVLQRLPFGWQYCLFCCSQATWEFYRRQGALSPSITTQQRGLRAWRCPRLRWVFPLQVS